MRHGFLLIDKPEGVTSHDAVAAVRRTLHERSIGHLGTLDPAASGLLVLAVGKKALKVVELFADLTKEYEASVRLGAVSSTYDREGLIEEWQPKPGWQVPEEGVVRRTIDDRFLGKISQVPPAYSAIKIGGERAYNKARQGRGVNIPPREVEIHSCEVVSYAYPDLVLRVHVSSGTYIRSLAHDLGQLLGCGGYLSALRRTKVGDWSVDNAKAPDEVAWPHVIPLKEVLAHLPRIDLTDDMLRAAQYGQDFRGRIEARPTIGWHDDLPVAVLETGKTPEVLHARKVL